MGNKNEIDFSTILASSVHDMKNSVGMLISSLETLLENYAPKTDEEKHHVQTLHYESSRISGELIQLLTLYRRDKGFLPVNIDEEFVYDVLAEQVARNQPLINSSGLDIQIACDEDFAWYFDADLVGGVVHNILVNCIRYTKTKIILKADLRDNYLCISIADDGPGYPDEMLKLPSHLVGEAQLSEGATHLGLFFAEELAALHKEGERKGRIELNNEGELGGGEFRLYLP